jgi:FkbM family methyltransferase
MAEPLKLNKKILKKILGPRQIRMLVVIRNDIRSLAKSILRKIYAGILRKIYAGDSFKLALMNLIKDDDRTNYQVFRYDNENVYFSWKNSYVGAILKETYVDSIYDWFFKKERRKDLIVLDLGANVGFFTQYARKFAKRVIAVEPSNETFMFLERAKTENNWQNVDVVNAAISDETRDEITLFHNENNTTMRSLNPNVSHGSSAETVKTLSLADLFKKYKIAHVDFVKMDVEGAELDIIKSWGFKSVLPMIDNIELEIHFPGAYEDEILGLFRGYNLVATKIKTTSNVYIVKKPSSKILI